MKLTAKRKFAKVAGIATALMMAATMGTTSLLASANVYAPSADQKFESDYNSPDEVLEAGKALNEKLADEGYVLLKNNNETLPLAKTERNVSLLGTQANDLRLGGGGSGSQSRPTMGTNSEVASASGMQMTEALTAVGFNVNERLANRFASLPMDGTPDGFGAIPVDTNHYMDLVTDDGAYDVEFGGKKYKTATDSVLNGADSSIAIYNDAAILVIARSGSEAADSPADSVVGHSDLTDHYLELNDSERELIAYTKLNFDKVIVVLNSPAVMELGELENDDAIDAIVWMGMPGWNGAISVGKILTGEVNPSGHTVDFWMRKFESDPTFYNFGNYTAASNLLGLGFRHPAPGETNAFGQPATVSLNAVNMEHDDASETTNSNNAIDYAEGIYVGYRYYETVATDMGEAGEAWYQDNTVYPFGHGLSYTTFSQEIVGVEGDLSSATGKVTVSVKVTNTGNVAGKEVVQLYNTPPYTAGGIDKAAVNLVGFAKTETLKAGRSETVDITIDVKDLASFDYNDANENANFGYELEEGDYVLSIRANSHDVLDSTMLECEEALTWDEDGNPSTPNNIYSQKGNEWEYANTLAHNWTVSGTDHYLHRDKLLNGDKTGPSDLKALAWLLTEDNKFTDEAFNVLSMRPNNSVVADADNWLTMEVEDDYQNLWNKTAADMSGKTQGAGTVGENGLYATRLYDMKGVAYDDPKWDEFINQVTWDEMVRVVSNGGFNNEDLETIGKPALSDSDGPGQLSSGWAWVAEVVIASTWNVELAEEQGRIVGNESMWISGGANNGWYGPAMNTHRNPLGGRVFEYYSQDGVQGGLIAAAVCKGATDAGCHVYVKHAFMNEQEANRVGVSTFATEQALRDIYAKTFELAVRKGNADGVMSSFNLIGIASSASYVTNVQLYTNEWGFRGLSVTDMWGMGIAAVGWTGYQLVRGLTLPLGNNSVANPTSGLEGVWDDTTKTVTVNGETNYTQWYWTRELFKRSCYVTVNGNGMDEGYLPYMFAGNDEIALTAGVRIANGTNILSADSLTELANVFGTSGYTLTATGLPQGVTMSASGVISGTPAMVSGGKTYEVTVSLQGENGLGYINGHSITLSIPVALAANSANISYTTAGGTTLTAGENYSATVAQTLITNENLFEGQQANATTYNSGNGYLGYTVTVEGLPAGLSYNAATGEVSGAPLQTGKYTVGVILAAEHVTSTSGGWWAPPTYGTETVYHVYYVELTVESPADATEVVLHLGTQDITATVSNASSIAGYIPTRADGYKFVGWATTENGAVLDSIPADATELYAIWDAPAFAIVNGYWYIDGVNTGISATGVPGVGGIDGADGKNGIDGVDGVNGKDGIDGINGADGINGSNGVGIENATINDKGELVLTYTDGNEVNLGKVVGADGQNGQDGASGCSGSVAAVSAITVIPALFALAIVDSKKRKASK